MAVSSPTPTMPPPPARARAGSTPETTAASPLRMFKALRYSLEGFTTAWRQEASFRFECILGMMLFPAAILLPMGLAFKGLLITSMFLVLALECINTAIESCIDYVSTERHPLAKIAKDLGSTAVFFSLLNCGVMWVIALVAYWEAWF